MNRSPFPAADEGRSMRTALRLAIAACIASAAFTALRVVAWSDAHRASVLDAATYAGLVAMPFWLTLLVVAARPSSPMTPVQRRRAWLGGALGAVAFALPLLLAKWA